MKNRGIGGRIEAGPYVSQNPEFGDNTPAPQPASPGRIALMKAGAVLALGVLFIDHRALQAAWDEEDAQGLKCEEMDINTGVVTEVYGDGRRIVLDDCIPTPPTADRIPVTLEYIEDCGQAPKFEC